jgi:peptidoglycan hydrolase-like protein with peptidoglycan-binding domain
MGLTLSACSSNRGESTSSGYGGPSVVDGVMGGSSHGASQSTNGQKRPLTHTEVVRKVQQNLAALGYEPGVADGAVGGKTEKAVRRYQADHGLKVDGKVTEKLLAHLEGKGKSRQSAKRTTKSKRSPVF